MYGVEIKTKKEIWSTFWGDYFTLMWVDQKHCLEYVLQKGLACIHRRDFASAATLLAPFPPLRSLLFILSVDHPSVSDIEAKQQLVKMLWKGGNNAFNNDNIDQEQKRNGEGKKKNNSNETNNANETNETNDTNETNETNGTNNRTNKNRAKINRVCPRSHSVGEDSEEDRKGEFVENRKNEMD